MLFRGYFYSIFFFISLVSTLTHSNDLSELPEDQKKIFTFFLSNEFSAKTARPEWSHQLRGQTFYHIKYPREVDSCPNIGICNRKNITIYHSARTEEEILFNTQYTFDKDRFRNTPLRPLESQEKHFILAGGSFALGSSIAVEDSLAYRIAKESSLYYPTNIAVAGTGPNTMLALVQNHLTPEMISRESGIFLYLFIDKHIQRANGFLLQRSWLWDTPVYKKLPVGKLVYQGNFKEAEPMLTRFYSFTKLVLGKLGLVLNFPRLEERHNKYTCAIILESKKSYLEKFPLGRFVTYSHPFSKMNSELQHCLRDNGVEYIISKIDWNKEKYQIKFDEHPNRLGNIAVYKELANLLKL